MGVNGLWSVVSPTARPTSLASLNRKRLAVDASIWIYQFLKAVRDKEGNALRNSHVVGFFRRICKLLYYGIKPVFVFDGGAPGLKRETVRKRRQRREGRREDAVRTAGKLLAVAMERRGVEERERERERRARGEDGEGMGGGEEEEIGDEAELVYVDEIGMDKTQRQKGRAEGFKRRDQYHLPDLDVRIEDMGAPNDPRIMSQAELEEYARQFHSGEDINLYDFSKIDFESPFFVSLPAGDRYNILNAARLRSRLRMGYTKDQLNGMFPDRMAFSKFQVERVRERNDLTQRLMNLNGMGDDWDAGGRIAGEKGKEYVLVQNDGVEGGWALGVVSNKSGTSKGMAIDVDEEDSDAPVAKSESEESDEFEDVEIEGLNRLPQSWKRKRARETDYDISYEEAAEKIANKRRAVYDARKAAANAPAFKSVPVASAEGDQDTLFVEKDDADDDDDLFEDVDIGIPQEDEDDDLQRAIAMSLEKGDEQRDKEPVEVANAADEEDSDDAFDMRAALTEARKSKHQAKTNVRAVSPKPQTNAPKFSGPLPFESLNLGQSLLGKKKAKKVEEGLSGGFDRGLGDDAFRKQRPAQPKPSWFEAIAMEKNKDATLDTRDEEDGEDHITMGPEDRLRRDILQRQPTKEVIDLDAEPSTQQQASQIELSSDDEEPPQQTQQEPEEEPDDWQLPEPQEEQTDAQEELRRKAEEEAREARYAMAREIAGEPEVTQAASMDVVAERAQEKPPSPTDEPLFIPSPKRSPEPAAVEEDEEMVEWSASEAGSPLPKVTLPPQEPTTGAGDSDDEFEDVPMDNSLPVPTFQHEPSNEEAFPALDSSKYLLPAEDEPETEAGGNVDVQGNDFVDEQYSDSDEEIMRQLAIEVEEHARFTNSLNNNSNKSKEEAVRDYENELKQLRNQQKKDRRDADEVTSTMIQECQALLRLFGLPYITAPMEAEAQCAEMVTLGLVDGIITDDSDIFLFGGTRVYKNMFSQNKFVECYLLADLEREYTLTRQKLISFAHLLGSDYTTGLTSIGPVTALEILTDFPTLTEFRDWCDKVQAAHRPADMEGLLSTAFRRKFKNAVQKRLVLPTAFPDLRVDQAYLQPEVDSDPEQFQWGVPDLDKLRSFLMATIGWSQERTDEVLVPVIRDMNRRETEGTQANITRFFSGGVGVGASTRVEPGKVVDEVMGQRNRTGKESGRMKNAWKRLRGEAERQRRGGGDDDGFVEVEDGVAQGGAVDDVDADAPVASTRKTANGRGKGRAKKGKKDQKAGSPTVDEGADGEEQDDVADDESFELPQRKRKLPAKRERGRRKVAVGGDD